ncbi:MAG: prolyl aminopeptidase [Hyphomicrobium sp.]|jgi:proline iminopeptidase|uniref:prolyl aminopeptidase n=1 Tax=Hyphomicrobium sp. TaxID=82 RepID=UPI0025C117F5|nr:prolyl aminopeptidase [Hyphomicrobium sp.]MBX9861583.1 prolyl aminopeptidase [Hyphomicrobium sp.]
MPEQFPPIEPYASGWLDVGSGHEVYWESCGAPDGKPALFLHGGPGSGCSPGQRRFFDPSLYRAVLFDQRGSGRSRPLASEPDADLGANTTAHLIADIEMLRERLGVDRWTILGLSWGTTLGLAYAQAHPHRVTAMVLGFVTTTSRREVQWITEDVGRIFPREWEQFASAVPGHLRQRRLVDAYAALLADPDPAVRDRAAIAWCAWEDAHVSLTPGHTPDRRYQDPPFRLRFARLVTHYWRHAAFLEENQLIRDAASLNGIPGVLIHGRYDVSGPLVTAWDLSRRWTTSRLHILDDAGHGGGNDFMPLVLGALREFAAL